nr:hypothetical protein CFP56_19542 [Quercus suber]
MRTSEECQRNFQWYIPCADYSAIHTDSTENDVSPGGVKRGYDTAFEDPSWIQDFQNLEHHGTDQLGECTSAKSIRHDSQAYGDGSSITAAHSRTGVTAALTTETSDSTDEHLFMQPSTEALAQIQHLKRELDEIKNLLPFLVATSTQRKAVSRLVERFLPRQSASCVPASSPLPFLAARRSTGGSSALVASSTHDYQSMNSSWRSITNASSPQVGLSQSPQLHAGSIASPVMGNDSRILGQQDLAAHGRSYIEIFGNLDLSAAIGASHHLQYVNMQIQQHSISSLWLADHEIDNAEERRVNSAFNRIRDRSRAQITWGVPQEAVFGLAYPALLFVPEGNSTPNMDDALTLSDWIARLLDQYPHTSEPDFGDVAESAGVATSSTHSDTMPTPTRSGFLSMFGRGGTARAYRVDVADMKEKVTAEIERHIDGAPDFRT